MDTKSFTAEYTAKCFLAVCQNAYVKPPSEVLVRAHEDEETAFHIMHKTFKEKSWDKVKIDLDDSYPFIKVGGRWFLSIPKLYIYLFRARRVLAMSDHPAMVTVYNAVQRTSKYFDEWKALDLKLTPKGAIDYEDYTKKQEELYKDYCADQLKIFGDE